MSIRSMRARTAPAPWAPRRCSSTARGRAPLRPPKSRTTGVLLANGSQFGGWAFYLKDGRPVALEAASQVPGDQFRIVAPDRLAPGKAEVTYAFTSDGGIYAGGEMAISVNGK